MSQKEPLKHIRPASADKEKIDIVNLVHAYNQLAETINCLTQEAERLEKLIERHRKIHGYCL